MITMAPWHVMWCDAMWCGVCEYVSGLQALSITYTPKEICALKGSKVRLQCTYTLPAGDRFQSGHWYKNDSWVPIRDSNRNIQHNTASPQCLLRIHNLTPRDAGSYEYRVSTQQKTILRGSGRAAVHVVGNCCFCICHCCITYLFNFLLNILL